MINLPSQPTLPDVSNVFDLWQFSDEAFEVTHVIQNLLQRLPPYFLAYFGLSFAFIVVGLLLHLIMKIL